MCFLFDWLPFKVNFSFPCFFLSAYYLTTSYSMLLLPSFLLHIRLFIPFPPISLLKYNLSSLHCLPCILFSLKIFLIPLSSWCSSFPLKLHHSSLMLRLGSLYIQPIAFTRFLSYNPSPTSVLSSIWIWSLSITFLMSILSASSHPRNLYISLSFMSNFFILFLQCLNLALFSFYYPAIFKCYFNRFFYAIYSSGVHTWLY